MVEISEDVVIVGGGIAGLATALALKKVGIRIMVLERSHELRSAGTAISLWPNALRALEALGVEHKLISLYPPLPGGRLTDVTTGATFPVSLTHALERGGKGLRSVHRRTLLEAMAEELPNETIRFSAKVAFIKTHTVDGTPHPVVHLEDGTVIKAKVLIGCDGIHSVVAQWLGLGEPVHSGRSAVRGMSVYPQGHGFDHMVRQFLGDDIRAGFVPLNDTELYWFATFNSSQDEGMQRDPQLIMKQVMDTTAKGFPETFLDVVRHSDLASLTWAPLMFRRPWELILRQLHKWNITVAGDAMHPMTSDMGQGGCIALEDAVVLGRNIAGLKQSDGGSADWGRANEALEKYVNERRWRVAGMVAGSYVSGWAQQSNPGWFRKMLRDKIFYKFVFGWLTNTMHYDCGALPVVSSSSMVEE